MRKQDEKSEKRTQSPSRRQFLGWSAAASACALSQRALAADAETTAPILLKDGLLLDGTGRPGRTGSLLVENGRIAEIYSQAPSFDGQVLDCANMALAPGFIDAHSHMDWVVPRPDHVEKMASFWAQGCTTCIAGNCGYGSAGFKKDSAHIAQLTADLAPGLPLAWQSMKEYGAFLKKAGISHNIALFAGHGTIRASMRGLDPTPLSETELAELLALLGAAMDEGAVGVSLGLQYAPGIFATAEELEAVARLVQEKGKTLAVHGRAYSCFSAEYPFEGENVAHNVLAMREMIGLARKTGVRLQYSHLMFAGKNSHGTYTRCLETLDAARAEGIDICTDTYPYHCGNSILSVILPRWFREKLPENYDDPVALKQLEGEFNMLTVLVGLGYEDIVLAEAGHPDMGQYNGMRITEIAEAMKRSPFEACMEVARKCHGTNTIVLLEEYSNMDIIDALMRHSACLFMTDAVPGDKTLNPAGFGSFPRFLQYARERKQISLEEAVRKMSGATAERFGLTDRGLIKRGHAADMVVFDPETIQDNTTPKTPYTPPTGIEAVFVNGQQVITNGQANTNLRPGQVLPI
jgi:N-acyl-D-amino-acid deacylase